MDRGWRKAAASRPSGYEFEHVSRLEKFKIAAAKTVCLVTMSACLLALVFSVETEELSLRLGYCAGTLIAFLVYRKLFGVKSRLADLMSPGFSADDAAIGILAAGFLGLSILL